MSKTHYDILGVERDATASAIKQAFRRKSSELHPDRKGGDEAAMAALNFAYELLSNPERRKIYDDTGNDKRVQPLDAEARELVMKVFVQLLGIEQDINFVEQAKKVLEAKIQEIANGIAAAREKQAQLLRRRGKVRARKGENFFHMLIDQQLAGIADGIRNAERAETVVRRALEMLDDFEGESPPAEAMVRYTFASFGGGTENSPWR